MDPKMAKGSIASDLPGDSQGVGAALSAPDEIGRILDKPPQLAEQVLRGDTRLTRRWGHGGLHDQLPGMNGHVVMTYHGAAQES